jgi:hypothetical protein
LNTKASKCEMISMGTPYYPGLHLSSPARP